MASHSEWPARPFGEPKPMRARGILFSSLTWLYLTLPVLPSSGATASELDVAPQNSKQASAAVLALESDDSQTRVNATPAQKVEKSTSDWWLVWLTAALVGVGAAQCLACCWQGSQLRRTVKTMDSTAIRQLRAYVLVADGEVKFPNPGTPEAQLVLRNFGKRLPIMFKFGSICGSNSIRCASFCLHLLWISGWRPPSCLLAVTPICLYPKTHRYHLRQSVSLGRQLGQSTFTEKYNMLMCFRLHARRGIV
jgi:hypothetical protein